MTCTHSLHTEVHTSPYALSLDNVDPKTTFQRQLCAVFPKVIVLVYTGREPLRTEAVDPVCVARLLALVWCDLQGGVHSPEAGVLAEHGGEAALQQAIRSEGLQGEVRVLHAQVGLRQSLPHTHTHTQAHLVAVKPWACLAERGLVVCAEHPDHRPDRNGRKRRRVPVGMGEQPTCASWRGHGLLGVRTAPEQARLRQSEKMLSILATGYHEETLSTLTICHSARDACTLAICCVASQILMPRQGTSRHSNLCLCNQATQLHACIQPQRMKVVRPVLCRPRFAAILQDPEVYFEQWQDEYKQVGANAAQVTAELAHASREESGQANSLWNDVLVEPHSSAEPPTSPCRLRVF